MLLAFPATSPNLPTDHQWFGFTNEIDLQKGDKFCFEARCVYGKHACNARNGRSTYFIVMTSIMATLAVITFFRAFHVAWLMKKANKWKNNATSTALVFNMIASLFWFPLVIGYDLAISEGDWGISDTLASIGIPFIFASLCVAYLNISLVWVQVAATSTSLKKVGKNMQRKTWYVSGSRHVSHARDACVADNLIPSLVLASLTFPRPSLPFAVFLTCPVPPPPLPTGSSCSASLLSSWLPSLVCVPFSSSATR